MNTEIIKNNTRIASLLGTWTGTTHLKTDIGNYELMAYFVIHIMPDPMRGYACSIKDCLEVENKACMWNDQTGQGECRDISNTTLSWSDVSAFMYFGAKIDVGFPFNKHRAEDTGGWIGPINIVMAQDHSTSLRLEGRISDDDGPDIMIVDRYVSRYVRTPSTEYIRMPSNCTLVRDEDFRKIAGEEAVQYTTEGQYDPDSNGGGGEDKDPYEKYLDTCENGDVKPMLPLFQFDFVKQQGQGKGDDDKETIEVKLNYKLMTMPRKKDYMYDIYPKIQNRVNRAGFGFHISGPYCYGNDPKRGYSFDMNFDSRDPKKMLNLEHACVEGLPCAPPAADLYFLSTGSSMDVKPVPDDAAVVDVSPFLYFGLMISILVGVILHLYRSNQKLRSCLEERQPSVQQDYNAYIPVDDDDENDGSAVMTSEDAMRTNYCAMEVDEPDVPVGTDITALDSTNLDDERNQDQEDESENLLGEDSG